MWSLTIRSPDTEPKEIELKPCKTTIGRMAGNDVVIEDISASRRHAEIFFDLDTDTVTIHDLQSTNGTFVNRQRVIEPCRLNPNDAIRIGQVVINLARHEPDAAPRKEAPGVHRYTRELLLESLDRHALLLYEAARKLNTVLDVETALQEVSNLVRRFMGADRCEVILQKQFSSLGELGFPETIARKAIEQRSAVIVPDMMALPAREASPSASLLQVHSAMCVPVISGDDLLALIYIYRAGPNSRPFGQHDLQLAVAIGNQAALTIQRMDLLDQLRQEQQIHQLLGRFLSPQEVEYLLQNYLASGHLPGLTKRQITVLFADIADSIGLAGRLGADHFARILESFYQDSTDIMFKYGGLIKLIGDGIMGIFGLPPSETLPEKRAVQAGIHLIERVRATGHLDPDHRVVIGIGINTGPAMVGYVGTQERVEFAVLGNTVNVAYLLQDYARPNRLIIGPATAEAITGIFNVQPAGGAVIRGRDKSIPIHEVIV